MQFKRNRHQSYRVMGYEQAEGQWSEGLVNPLPILVTMLHYMNVKHRPIADICSNQYQSVIHECLLYRKGLSI